MSWGRDMSWVVDLKVGDRVFMESQNDCSPQVVTKVTPKRITVGEYWTFRRDNGRQIGGDTYFSKDIHLPTEALEIAYKAAGARGFLRGTLWSKITDADVIRIAAEVRGLLPKDK